MKIERFEDIIAWQKSKELSVQVYGMFKTVKISVLKTRYSGLRFQ
jgi:hypothetical protein